MCLSPQGLPPRSGSRPVPCEEDSDRITLSVLPISLALDASSTYACASLDAMVVLRGRYENAIPLSISTALS